MLGGRPWRRGLWTPVEDHPHAIVLASGPPSPPSAPPLWTSGPPLALIDPTESSPSGTQPGGLAGWCEASCSGRSLSPPPWILVLVLAFGSVPTSWITVLALQPPIERFHEPLPVTPLVPSSLLLPLPSACFFNRCNTLELESPPPSSSSSSSSSFSTLLCVASKAPVPHTCSPAGPPNQPQPLPSLAINPWSIPVLCTEPARPVSCPPAALGAPLLGLRRSGCLRYSSLSPVLRLPSSPFPRI